MTDYTLPPLPAPFGALERDGLWNGLPREGHDDVYDAEQMTAYAEAARAPLLARIAELDHRLLRRATVIEEQKARIAELEREVAKLKREDKANRDYQASIYRRMDDAEEREDRAYNCGEL